MSLIKVASVWGLNKEARSDQAKQRRGYERLLKSDLGGTEGYMNFLQNSGQRSYPDVYLSMNSDDAAKALVEGVPYDETKSGNFGKGTVVTGDLATSQKIQGKPVQKLRYTMPDGSQGVIGNLQDKPSALAELQKLQSTYDLPEDAANALSEKRITELPGTATAPQTTLRFKKPYEIQGTNSQYPRPENVKVLDLTPYRPSLLNFPNVSDAIEYNLNDGDGIFYRATGRGKIQDMESKTPFGKRIHYGMLGDQPLFRHNPEYWLYPNQTPDRRQFLIQQDIPANLLTTLSDEGPSTVLDSTQPMRVTTKQPNVKMGIIERLLSRFRK